MVFLLAQSGILEGAFNAFALSSFETYVLGSFVVVLVGMTLLMLLEVVMSTSKSTRKAASLAQARGRAEQLRAQNSLLEAATILENSGQLNAAATALVEANEINRAVKIFFELGQFHRGVYELSRHNLPLMAAKMYEKEGHILSAAYEYEKASRFDIAARLYEQEHHHYDAARTLRKCKVYQEASKAFERVGNYWDAAEALLDHLRENSFDPFQQDTSRGPLASRSELRNSSIKAAELLARVGSQNRAAQIFEVQGEPLRAAEAYLEAGLLQQASQNFRKAGKLRQAADLEEEFGEQAMALATRAEAAISEGNLLEAAKLYSRANEPLQAATYFERSGAIEEAAEHYERGNDYANAVRLLARLKNYVRAARVAEQANDLRTAITFYKETGDLNAQIRLYKQMGELSQAAKLLLELRRLEEAEEIIESMNAADPGAMQVFEAFGDILSGRGQTEEAYARYRTAVGNRPVNNETLSLYKKMSKMLFETDELGPAQELLKQIITFKPDDSASIQLLSELSQAQARRQEQSRLARSGVAQNDIRNSQVNQAFGHLTGVEQQQDRYEILEEIARGGMGIVYKAKDRFLDRTIALKVLNENFAENQLAIEYFVREARSAASLNHPTIVTIFDVGQQQGYVFMAMELIDGTTLKNYIRHKGVLSEPQIIWIAIQCCTALDFAHSRGIIHRDIKSGNAMLTRDKSLKIMDFGLAKAIRDHQGEHTQLIGTPYYMSPEQVSGVNVDFRSDLYSLGCMLYECATGRVPFKEGEPAYHHVHTLPVPPKERNPEISDTLNAYILRLLEKNPDNRFQSAGECLEYVKTM